MERLHILDGYGYIFRAHFGLAHGGRDRQEVRLTTRAGMPTGALYVYASMLIRLYLDVRPERIVVVFDAPGRTFRDELDGDYKATRNETPDDLKLQMPYFRPITESFSWPVLAVEGVEADDVIATLVARARARDWDVVIYAADKDLMQLVDDRVVVIDSMRQRTFDIAGVTAKFGVGPDKVADWLALVGDSSDNIPGVAGVGAKTAAKLLSDFGSIEGVFANIDSIKGKLKERLLDPEQRSRLDRSRELVKLRADLELPVELDELRAKEWRGQELEQLFKRLEFDVLLERLSAKGADVDAAPADASPIPAATIARSAADVAELAAAARATGRIAITVETDGQRGERAQLVGIAAAVPDRAPLYLPLTHRYLGVPAQLSRGDLEPLAEVLRDPAVAVVGHDLKNAVKALARAGIAVAGIHCDTMLAAYLLDASSEDTSLPKVIKDATGLVVPSRRDFLGSGKRAVTFDAVGVEQAAGWAGSAAGAVLRASGVLERRLAREGLAPLWKDVELPLLQLLAKIEPIGICVDAPYLRALSDRVGRQIAELEARVHALAGEQINLGSPKQLSALLFDRLGLESDRMKKTKTGFSTDHEVLEALAGEHEIVSVILEHRELVKLRGTYIDALPPLIDPRTGRVHTDFRQAVTATGRLSSQDPNLQNIPIRSELGQEIRRAFVAPPGKALVSADYSQIELRVLAHMCGDPLLTRAFAEGIDIHTQTAAEVFGIPLTEVGDRERRVAKAVNYGLIYGQSDFGLSRALDIPRTEARHYIDRYFDRLATVRQFMDRMVKEADRAGYATTLLGRRRPIADLRSRNYRLRGAAERIAQNTPIQGSGADIMKLAMLRVDAMLERSGFDAHMLLTVHDELVFEVAEAQAQEVAQAIAREMETAYPLTVPLQVDVGIGKNWADAH